MDQHLNKQEKIVNHCQFQQMEQTAKSVLRGQCKGIELANVVCIMILDISL